MTHRQRAILDFIDYFWEENWTSPNVRQITEAVGLASKSTTHDHLQRMVRAGILERKAVDRYRVMYRRPRTS